MFLIKELSLVFVVVLMVLQLSSSVPLPDGGEEAAAGEKASNPINSAEEKVDGTLNQASSAEQAKPAEEQASKASKKDDETNGDGGIVKRGSALVGKGVEKVGAYADAGMKGIGSGIEQGFAFVG